MGVSTQMTLPLPEQPVAIGESWSSPIEIDVTLKDGSQKKVQTRQKFTLESVTDGIAHIAMDSQVLTPISDPSIEAQLVQRMSSGWVKFDIEAGRVLSQQLELDKHIVGFNGPPAACTTSRGSPRSSSAEGQADTEAAEQTAERGEEKNRQ